MPKIIGKNLQEHRDRTRVRLFTSLSKLLSEQGFDSLTMAQIAQGAKVGRTAVYNHFTDKESLLLAYIEYETIRYSHSLRENLEGVEDPIEQLRIYISHQIDLSAHYRLAPGPDLRKIMNSSNVRALHGHASLVEDVLLSILTAGIEKNSWPLQDVTGLIPLIHACLSGWAPPKDPAQLQRFTRLAQGFILRAVGVSLDDKRAEIPDVPHGLAELMGSGTSCPVAYSVRSPAHCPVN
ncbi:MAG: TetR/AcrR family transcriptional regulator [Actinomycetaceae bacterium]|nr:TetR/AcrR family transcriptional regulator [Actinomycetaceae bacterium]